MSQFSVKGDKSSKLRFAFRIYDMDNDGYISNGELFQVNFFSHFGAVGKNELKNLINGYLNRTSAKTTGCQDIVKLQST